MVGLARCADLGGTPQGASQRDVPTFKAAFETEAAFLCAEGATEISQLRSGCNASNTFVRPERTMDFRRPFRTDGGRAQAPRQFL